MKEQYYSIGQIAELSNISIPTLRYYDQINLYKPAHVDPQTNYRYYKESQLYILDMIKSLKFVGTPLEEIKAVLNYTSAELLGFLEHHEDIIEGKIQRLQEIQKSLHQTKKQFQKQMKAALSTDVFEKTEDLCIFTLPIENYALPDIPSAYYSVLIKLLESEGSTISSHYGCIYPFLDYHSMDEVQCTHIFTPLMTDRLNKNPSYKGNIRLMSESRFMCVAFRYHPDQYIEHYQRLYHYIHSNKLPVADHVYELFMPTRYSQQEEDEFMVELKVQLL
ncbi:helix-turn-helix domain-containing protein [Desulfitobacterium sp. PCE1]|uniref:MerR family transcriptional regulator n=1 Tax=Desulfitobacterium sp. PCE1 TaxID=146907 RepID=UPI000382E8D9|nr:MerR family transcriptional regulator [Desulfitobacterium sp. PCE1]